MKERLNDLPENFKNKFTPEMKKDIEAEMTLKEFFEKYSEDFKNFGI